MSPNFIAILFIGILVVGYWIFQRWNAPKSPKSPKAGPVLNSGPYDQEYAARANILRERFDNPYWYSGTSGYPGANELDEEIRYLRDPFEWRDASRKERHDRLWLIAQLEAHKRDLQRQWRNIQARSEAEKAERLAQVAVYEEQARLARIAQEKAAAQAAREAAEQAERERQAYREAIAKAASQAPKEAP